MTPHLPVQVPGPVQDGLPPGVSEETKKRREQLLYFMKTQMRIFYGATLLGAAALGSGLPWGNPTWLIIGGYLVGTFGIFVSRSNLRRELDRLEQTAIGEVLDHNDPEMPRKPRQVISNATITQGPDGALVATSRIDGSRYVITGDSVLKGEAIVSVRQIRPPTSN